MGNSEILGISVIIVAWILQLASSWNGSKEIKKRFIILYAVGSALLVIDGQWINEDSAIAFVNVLCMLLACLVLIKISNKEKLSETKIIIKRKKRGKA
jgi:hypothetical protein